MLQTLIDTYEEVKKNIYIIDRGNIDPIIIKFGNENFYHLVGMHKMKLDSFFPSYMKSKDKRYKYIKKNVEKYQRIIDNQTKGMESLHLRITTFSNILDLLNSDFTRLYNLKTKTAPSMYNGEYGLLGIYDGIYCLLGLKLDDEKEQFLYAPQSWMASKRKNTLIEYKPVKAIRKIMQMPMSIFGNNCTDIYKKVIQITTIDDIPENQK